MNGEHNRRCLSCYGDLDETEKKILQILKNCHLFFFPREIRISTQSLTRRVLIQSCSAGAKNFTNYVVFCHPKFSGVIQNIENRCAILTLFVYVDYCQNNQFLGASS